MRGKLKRKFAVVMASVLALSNIQTAPVFAAVEEERTILRFEELPEKYAVQELELGAAKEDIRFPDSLWADMVIVKQKNEESKTEETEEKEAGKTEEGKAETEPSVEAEESSGADSTTEQQAGDADSSVSAEKEKALPGDGEKTLPADSSDDGTVSEPETTGSDTTGTVGQEKEEEPEIKQPESDAEGDDSPDTGLESEKPAKEENDAGKTSGNLPEDSGNSEEQKTPVATGSEAEKPEKDHDSDDKVEKTVRRRIRDIEWELNFTESSDAEFQSEIPGTYVYEPVIPSGYEIDLEVELPQILVKVGAVDAEEKPCTKTEGCTLPDGHEGECVPEVPPVNALVKNITSWTFVDDGYLNEGELVLPGVSADNPVDFDTVVLMLPTAIHAEIEGAQPEEIGLGWTCGTFRQDENGSWPVAGSYTFTAELPEGYACDPLPAVRVLLGGADLEAEYGGLTIEGGGVMQEADGQIILGSGSYTISGEWNGTLNDVSAENKKAVLTVPAGVNATVKLDGVKIDVSGEWLASAFAVGGEAHIIFSGSDNTLASGYARAGLEVPENTEVLIEGDDDSAVLTVNGGVGIGGSVGLGNENGGSGGTITINSGTIYATGVGAGIGGGYSEGRGNGGSGGIITINGGTVHAKGSSGAGIGGGASVDGDGGSGGTITINNGTVEATGGRGAGIGGGSALSIGNGGDGGVIKIINGSVIANGDGSSAGIGGGQNGNGGDITISGGTVNATSELEGAGIGGGYSGDGGTITISGGTVDAVSKNGGAGVGGGATGNGGTIRISGGIVTATSKGYGAGVGGGGINIAGGDITISGGTVSATSEKAGSGIGGGYKGAGGTVAISGSDTTVTATGNGGGYDVGCGAGDLSGSAGTLDGGSLSVTNNAALIMNNTGTNVTDPEYRNCSITDKDGNTVHYDNKGKEVKITEEDGIKIIASEGGEVNYTEGSGFTLSRNGAYTISGDWSGSLNANKSTPKAVITVPDTVTADVTLNGVNIDVTVPYYACAFAVEGNGTANITLSGSNLLTSASARAGLEVPENAECTIMGGSSDTLTATGGNYSAGIGGGDNGSGGTIIISGGTVTANGGNGSGGGAGIGGGNAGSGGDITISGGTVKATGGNYSAGIGGGYRRSGGTITISGGTVTANGGAGSSGGGGGGGIGGGMSGDGGTIEISGGTVNATGRDNGAGIGGGGGIVSNDGGGGGNINITGGVVTATGDAKGAGIGGGGTEEGSGGSAGTIVINGNTVVFAATGNNGVPIGGGGNNTNNGEKSGILTGGVIFEGTEGTVYGSSSLPEDLKISNGSTLTVPNGSSLTIPDNTTLTNNGTLDNYGTIDGNGSITNNGTVNDHSGGISVAVTGSGANNKPSEVTVTFQNSKGETITEAVSGDTITITATAQTKTTSASYRSAAKEKVDFYIGTIAEDHKIGTADVVADSSTAAATLTIPLSGDTWGKGFVIGSNTITADFGGAAAVSLLDSIGTAALKVKSVPTLSLTADPPDAVDLPNNVILKATLLNASPGNQGKTITFTAANGTYTAITDSSGVAACTITNLTQGTYTFGASFAGDTDNSPAVAADINGYSVGLGTQAELTLNGLNSAYTYGCDSFSLSTSGGSGSGAVSYTSNDSSVASVTGNTVTIQKAGKFTITAAKAADSSFKEASVTSSEVTVSPATPDISMTATGGSNINDPIILIVTVAKAGTGMIPTGTVTFSEGSTVLAADVSLNGSGEASFTVSNLTAGNHTYTSAYSGQTGYYIGRSVTRNFGVGLADQTGFVITAPSTKTYGDSDFTLTASGGQSTGGVSFSVPSGNGVLTVSADGAVKITGAGSVKVTATKAGDNSYNEATATQDITVAPRDISNATVTITGSRVYTGSQLQPVFEVKDGSIAITTGDFTNSYGDNLDAGTGSGSITLAGQHNYTGTATVRFDIEQRSLTGAVIILAAEAYDYTGSEIRPAVTSVTVDGITVPDSEFDVDYHDNITAGTAVVTVRAKTSGNFRGEANAIFTITKSSGGHSSGSNGSSSDNSAVSNPSVLNGYWQQLETGEWKFLLSTGGYAADRWGLIDGRWYYFNHSGRMVTDWQQLNGVWYYLATSEDAKRTEGMKEGEMRTGWIYDLFYRKWFYLDKDGAMATGWREIDGKWYYFNPAPDGMRGAMVTDAWVDDWYLNQDGIGINQTRR